MTDSLRRIAITFACFVAGLTFASAQDVRGIEICTVEKQIDRRTSCLQSNVEFLHQTLTRQTRESNEKLAATQRDLASARAEIASLKDALARTQAAVDELKKASNLPKK